MKLAEAQKQDLQDRLITLFRDEFDEDLSDFKAAQVLESMVALIGPAVYNQAVEDVRAYFQSKIDDLDGAVYADDSE